MPLQSTTDDDGSRLAPWHAFDRALSVSVEDIELELHGHADVPWADFLLNPRRLRGSDFWKAKMMPAFDRALTPQARLHGRPGLPKTAVVPTVIVKEEDRGPLRQWQVDQRVPLHIWHAFFDLAYGLAFDTLETLIADGFVEETVQVFQAPNGATSRKTIYKTYYHHAYALGEATTDPELEAAYILDKNGHILPYVKFQGGSLRILDAALRVLDAAATKPVNPGS